MRTCLIVSAAFGLLLGLAGVRGDEQSEAKAIVERAIKATGGEENLKKFTSHTWKEKGTYYGAGAGQPYQGTYAVQFPDKFKMDISGVFVLVLNGDKGWIVMGGQAVEMTKEQLAEQKVSHYAGHVSTLLPLKDKSFKLAPIGEQKIDNRSAIGVKASKKDHQDVTLWFDKENGRIVKFEYKGTVAQLGGKEVHFDTYLSNYQEIEGAWIPMKIVMKRDGQDFVEAENYDLKPEKLDASVFAKPS